MICDECETVAHCMKNGCVPKTTKKDEALRLALEALTHGCPPDCKDGMTDSGGIHPWGEAALVPCPNCEAITALRDALAERPWVGLTDEERGQIINANFGTGLWSMAKDVEAKLKEKNT